jgi:hypothetical protein
MKVFQDPTSLKVGHDNRSSATIDRVDESRRARRERERWQKEMLRRLEELDRLDQEQGLGTYPSPEGPRHRRPGAALAPEGARVQRRRRTHGPVLPGLLIAMLIAGAVMARAPDATGYRFQQLVDELTGHDGSYKFVHDSASGPVAWDPCRPIHYVVNPEGAPADWADTVEAAVQEISEASKFEFEYDGTTDDRRFDDRFAQAGEDPPPVLVSWADPGDVPELEGQTAGIGGSASARTGGHTHLVTGIVVLDQGAFEEMHRTGRNQAERLILAHELGHVLGLDHVDDSGELMNPEYVGQRGFGDGDRDGFAVLHDQPCE